MRAIIVPVNELPVVRTVNHCPRCDRPRLTRGEAASDSQTSLLFGILRCFVCDEAVAELFWKH